MCLGSHNWLSKWLKLMCKSSFVIIVVFVLGSFLEMLAGHMLNLVNIPCVIPTNIYFKKKQEIKLNYTEHTELPQLYLQVLQVLHFVFTDNAKIILCNGTVFYTWFSLIFYFLSGGAKLAIKRIVDVTQPTP